MFPMLRSPGLHRREFELASLPLIWFMHQVSWPRPLPFVAIKDEDMPDELRPTSEVPR